MVQYFLDSSFATEQASLALPSTTTSKPALSITLVFPLEQQLSY